MSIQDHYAVIQDNLLLGRCPYDQKELEDIKTRMGASAVLSLQHDECLRRLHIDYERHVQHGQRIGLTLRRYPLLDHDLDDQQWGLPGAVTALRELLDARHRVYLHCTLGLNRAPTVALAYLTVIEGMSVASAIRHLQQVRPSAEPSWEVFAAYYQAVA